MNSKLLTPQATHANNVYGEVYENGKREESEEMDQTAVLIEPEKCHRIDKISENNKRKSEIIKQSIKRQALKKPVLSTLDILISIFVVTPLVVTCWRGTWILMDLNFYYFPVWESFTIGIAAHVTLAIGQNVFHDIVIKTEINKWYLRALFFILMKIYTYVFLIITNLHWRGGWAIMDKYCGLEIKNRQLLHYEASLGLGAVCLVLIFLMKCLKNATSPPFAICMDKGDDMFLFPTMFRQKGLLLIAKICEQNLEELPNNQTSEWKYMPRGFSKTIVGPIPRQFIPQTTTERSKVTTLSNPQLSYRSTVHHPRNIQDILGYMTRTRLVNTRSEASNIESSLKTTENNLVISDPFFKFKPNDPSDINLLATASFRFAPPAWRNYLTDRQHVQSSTIQTVFQEKPLSITLNIFPMEEQMQSSIRSQRIGNKINPRGDSNAKMTINLKVYPEVVGANELEQIYAETKHRKIISNNIKFKK